MQVVSIVNLKGGVGKTTTAVNLAYELAVRHRYRVLLVDADHQGNASKFYEIPANDGSLMDLIEGRATTYSEVVTPTAYRNLDVIPADMSLLSADLSMIASDQGALHVLPDLRAVIEQDEAYDFIVIDCPPAFTAASVSAISASTDIVIPIKLDYYAIDGMRELANQIRQIQSITDVHIAGALITQWHNSDVIRQGEAWLRRHNPCSIFATHIRRTDVVDKSTYWRRPLAACSPRSAATADYAQFAQEFLEVTSRGTQI